MSYLTKRYDDNNYDIGFNTNARKNNVFLYMVNLRDHGHLKVLISKFFEIIVVLPIPYKPYNQCIILKLSNDVKI